MKKITVVAAATALATAGGLTATLLPDGIAEANAASYSRSAYGPNPNASKVNQRNTDNGWGAPCQSGKNGTAVSKSGDKVVVRKELVPLVTELMNRTEDMGYKIRMSGGYNCRKMRGSNAISNHARARAVDINWDTNPFQRTFKSDIPPAVVAMWEQSGFYWGGRYTRTADAMHFEFYDTPASVNGYLAKLRGSKTPAKPPVTNPVKPKPQPKPASCDFSKTSPRVWKGKRDNDKAAVREVQCRLAAKGYTEVGAADGIFGKNTDKAVRRFQRNHGLVADGAVGPKTWAKLNA